MRAACLIGLALLVLGVWQGTAAANCPSGYPNEIFCDDFDTYCNQSAGGHPGDPKCPTDGSATYQNQRLSEVWLREPREYSAGGTGVEVIVEEAITRLTSAPYGGRYPCTGASQYSPNVIRDWVNSPPGSLALPGQIRNLSWKIQQLWGVNNTALVGTDDQPLVLQYMVDGGGSGKIAWDNGYIGVSLDDGDEFGKLDTANTDYALGPVCSTYCVPTIAFEAMPILCAQGNPNGTMPSACPDVATNPPPIRNIIAVGVLGMLDTDPCHCIAEAHGPTNNHLSVFNGQKWFMLRSNSPMLTTGGVTPDPAGKTGLGTPGDFALNGGVNGGKSFNWVTLTIKTTTFDVELRTQERAKEGGNYYVTSLIRGLPRAYTGPFNALRMGVDEGCEILGSDSNPWACGGSNTHPLRSRAAQAGSLVYDDIYFYGGAPITEEGACCLPDASCSVVPADQCTGVFRGRSTTCETLSQPCCPKAFGDANGDGDVDLEDFAALQRCLTFGDVGATVAPECRCLDFDGGGAIDSVDLERFAGCASGPDIPANDTGLCAGIGW